MARAAKKATAKSRYFVQVDGKLIDAVTGLPAVSPIALSGDEAKVAGEDPSFYEVTKRQYDQTIDRIQSGSVFFINRVREEVKERSNSTGDYVWAILLFGAGFLAGAILL